MISAAMRWLVPSAVVVAAVSAAAVSASALANPVARPAAVITATGRVTQLDLSTIRVGRTSCSYSAKSAELAEQFDVGENVTIVCVRGVLSKIGLQPIGAGHPSSGSIIVAPVEGGRPAPAGSASASGPTATGSAEGPITALTATSITVGGVTCPFSASSPIAPELAVGDF